MKPALQFLDQDVTEIGKEVQNNMIRNHAIYSLYGILTVNKWQIY